MESSKQAAASNRFDYIAYDEQAKTAQAVAKNHMLAMESFIETELKPGRSKALALTKLEEVYMWIGKAIRDEQVQRTGESKEMPQRSNE